MTRLILTLFLALAALSAAALTSGPTDSVATRAELDAAASP